MDKKKQIDLNDLIGKKEVIKAGNTYPDLYSQMSYSFSDLERTEQRILGEIKELYDDQGDFIVSEILKSICPSFINEFMQGNGNRGNGDEEISFTRNQLFDFSVDLGAKIEAAIRLKSVFDRSNLIREIKSRIELTKKGILL